MDFAGRVAVVTGAGRGLGRAYAETLARHGARVVIAELDERTGPACAADIRAAGGSAAVCPLDAGDPDRVRACLDFTRAEFGGVDILVNNAGNPGIHPSVTTTEAEWERLMRVNLYSTFLGCQVFGRAMIQRGTGGAIVNISSIAAVAGFPMRAGYSAAKAAISSLTRVLALEWARYGIRVNAVAPGMTRTERYAEVQRTGHFDESRFTARIPQQRMAAPSEIAQVVAFLASDSASYVTGQTWYVDGGWTARGTL